MAYNGSVELISGIKQKNNGTFALVDASAVRVDDSKRLDAALAEKLTAEDIDDELKTAGKAADAKAVGDALATATGGASALANEAATFSDDTAYAAGTYVLYNDALYRFTTAHAAGAWVGTDAVAVTIAAELTGINGTIGLATASGWSSMSAGKYVNMGSTISSVTVTDGRVVPDTTTSRVRYIQIPATEGDIFYVTTTGGTGSRAYGFITADGTILPGRAPIGAVLTNEMLTAPAGAAILVVNDTAGDGEVIYNAPIGTRFDDLKSELEAEISGVEAETAKAMQYRRVLSGADDLDAIRDIGLYRVASTSLPTNRPAGISGSGVVIVNPVLLANGGISMIVQFYYTTNAVTERTDAYYRFYVSSTWYSWQRILTDKEAFMGNQGALTVADDLNTVRGIGVYRCTVANMPENAPVSIGGVLVVYTSSLITVQRYYTTTNSYYRYYSNNRWNSWVQDYNTSDLDDTLSQAGKLADAGAVGDALATKFSADDLDATLRVANKPADAAAVGAAIAAVSGGGGAVLNEADTFDDTKAYAAGEYVLYNNLLYRFIQDHAAGAWTGDDAIAVKLGPELASTNAVIEAADIKAFQSYPTQKGYVYSTQKWRVVDGYYTTFVPVKPNDFVEIRGPSIGAHMTFCVLRSYPTITAGDTPDFSTGEGFTARIQIGQGELKTYLMPSDAAYMGISTLLNNVDTTPRELKINGTNHFATVRAGVQNTLNDLGLTCLRYAYPTLRGSVYDFTPPQWGGTGGTSRTTFVPVSAGDTVVITGCGTIVCAVTALENIINGNDVAVVNDATWGKRNVVGTYDAISPVEGTLSGTMPEDAAYLAICIYSGGDITPTSLTINGVSIPTHTLREDIASLDAAAGENAAAITDVVSTVENLQDDMAGISDAVGTIASLNNLIETPSVFWTRGAKTPATGATTSSTTRLITRITLADVTDVYVDEGYKYIIAAYDDANSSTRTTKTIDGQSVLVGELSYVGMWNGESFVKSAAWHTEKTCLRSIGNYFYRIQLAKTNDTEIVVADGVHCHLIKSAPNDIVGVPVLNLSGDTSTMTKDDKVTLDWRMFGRQGVCTVKWQGSSSTRYPKKNYTISIGKSSEFSETKKYAKGDYVTHGDATLYKFITKHAAGAWNPDEVVVSTYAITDTNVDAWANWVDFLNKNKAVAGDSSSMAGVPYPSRWGFQKKFCTKANWVDASHARNIVCARLWTQIMADRIGRGEITDGRLSAPCYGAINGFPVEIKVNGVSQGLYTMNIPKDPWMFSMGVKSAAAFDSTKAYAAGDYTEYNGTIYRFTTAHVSEAWIGEDAAAVDTTKEYLVTSESSNLEECKWNAEPQFAEITQGGLTDTDFEVEYPDPDDEPEIAEALRSSFTACVNAARAINTSTGSDWQTTMAPYLDIQSAIDYYIFCCCINHSDGMPHNIIYGTYDGTKWFFSAYDLDTTFGVDAYGRSWGPVWPETNVINRRCQFRYGADQHRIFKLIYNHSKSDLVARYRVLRAGILSDENVYEMLTNYIINIPSRDFDADRQIWPDIPGTTMADISHYMDFYRMHCAHLDDEIDAMSSI